MIKNVHMKYLHFFLETLPALDFDLFDSLPDMEDERDLAFPLPLELTSELVTDESEILDELLPLESDDKVIGLSIEGMSLIRTSSSVLLNRLTMFS